MANFQTDSTFSKFSSRHMSLNLEKEVSCFLNKIIRLTDQMKKIVVCVHNIYIYLYYNIWCPK